MPPSTSHHLPIVRSSGQLLALGVPLPRRALPACPARLRLRTTACTDLPPARRLAVAPLVRAHTYLGSQARLNRTTLQHLVTLLRHTDAAPVLPDGRAPVLDRRRPTDLRPHLEDPHSLRGIIAQLTPFGIPPLPDLALDAPLTPAFTTRLLPFVAERSDLHVLQELERLAVALDTLLRPEIEALTALLLEATSPRIAASWLHHAASQPVDRQASFLLALLKSPAHQHQATPEHARLFAVIPTGGPGRTPELELDFVFRSIAKDHPPAFTLAALRHGHCHLLRSAPSPEYPVPAGTEAGIDHAIALRVINHHERERPASRRLWYAAAHIPGAAELFARLPLGLDPHALAVADAITSLIDRRTNWRRSSTRTFTHLTSRWSIVAAQLENTPSTHITKYLTLLDDYFLYRRPNHDGPIDDEFLDFAARFSKQPFGADVEPVDALHYILAGPSPSSPATLSDTCLKHLEKVCRNTTRSDRIERGAAAMNCIARWRFRMFQRQPKAFLRLAARLGALRHSRARQVVTAFRHHPLATTHRRNFPDGSSFLDFVRHVARPHFQDPVPRELAAHASGETPLSKPRLGHYVARFDDNLTRLAIAVLDDLIDGALTSADPHTGLVVDGIRENRRALVRYLRTPPARSTDFAHTHPNNRRWLDTRTALDTGAWLGTLSAGYRLKDGTPVTLEQESDPHQILRMGSLVGSCLGIGGMYVHSLVPNLLDANKRVVFARNTDTGAFLARQLVAVTEDEKLACFDVYPVTTPDEIVRLFRLYDESLALDLGIPQLNPDHDYHIPTLTCRDWYDDVPTVIDG